MSDATGRARRQAPDALQRRLASEMSVRARMSHVAVGLAGALGAGMLVVLWATEPQPLPVRTQAAFTGLIGVGLARAGYAGWVLRRRRPLFANDSLAAARLAVAASVLFLVLGVAVAASRGDSSDAVVVAVVGSIAIVVTVGLMARAGARRRTLRRLREDLQKGGPSRRPTARSEF